MYAYNVRVSVHYSTRVSQVLKQVSSVFDLSDIETISFNDLYYLLLNHSDCEEDEAKRIAYTLYPAESVERIMENPELESLLVDNENHFNEFDESLSLEKVHDALNALTKREREVISYRFGFDSYEESSLEDVGKRIGISRERIRQIEAKAMRKMVDYLYREHYISQEQYYSVVDNKDKKNLKRKSKKQHVVTRYKKN